MIKQCKIFTSKLLSTLAVLLGLIVFIVVGKKTYDLATAPKEEKDCDFVYPNNTSETTLDISYFALDNAPFVIQQKGGVINDASCLNKTMVYGIAQISSEENIKEAIQFARDNNLKITPAGERHSMGGQSFSRGGLVLNMREFNEIKVDKDNKILNVQSGASWKEVQAHLDPIGLSVKAMQSINIFTVGGTLSVNAHGIAHDPGQIAPTVLSMRVMLSSGEVKKASPTENSELFKAVLGGYGLLGVILDVDLEIVDNDVYTWKTDYIDYKDFSNYYNREVAGNEEIGLMYGRLSISPTSYLKEMAIHRYEYNDLNVEPTPLQPASKVWIKRLVFNLSKTGDIGRWIRWTAEKYIEPGVHTCISRNQAIAGGNEEVCFASRNQKMNQSMEYLDVKQRDTNILHEYFIPQGNTTTFIDELREIVTKNEVNLLNITLRIVTKDTITALPYAKDDRIAFVLYFNQKLNKIESEKLEKATVELINLAIANGGTYYLPYQLHYSIEQLRAAYPEFDEFLALKREYDPVELFSNTFYEKYGS